MSSSPDIIKDASDALRPISDRGITVMQGWYDKDIHDRHDRGIGVRPCPVRWQPWQRVEVRFVVLECEQPCDEREHEHRGEPILSNYGAFNQKHTFFLHRRVLKYT